MPKQKTHKGISKRMKLTGSGKVRRRRSCGSHLMSTKNSKRRRRIGSSTILGGSLGKTAKSLLGK